MKNKNHHKVIESYKISKDQREVRIKNKLQALKPEKLGIGTKRNRFLIRQPRIKRDSDPLNTQSSEMIELETAGSSSSRGLLSVPPKIERHASEPAPSMTPSSPHLLPIPQSTPFLMKQHSHPLLPSQSPPAPLTSSGGPHGIGLNLHRQLSHPISQATTLSVTESIQLSSSSTTVLSTGTLTNTPGLVQFVTAPIKTEAEKLTGVHSPSVLIVTEPITTTSCAIENIPTLRVKSEELQRSVSSPQATRELTLENPRSSHCPVIRPGPALGCNFCWNTIDAHGRILRRKTKYHCPECQTNLCIVPCFQEYHERQASENPSNNDNTSSVASSSSKTLAGLRHYPKTGSL